MSAAVIGEIVILVMAINTFIALLIKQEKNNAFVTLIFLFVTISEAYVTYFWISCNIRINLGAYFQMYTTVLIQIGTVFYWLLQSNDYD